MFQLPTVYFEKLLESSPDVVVAVDIEGTIIFYNDGARKTLAYSPEEIMGQHVTLIYPSLEEARKVKAAMRSEEFEEQGKVKNFETVLIAKSGEAIPMAISGSIIYDESRAEVGSIGFLKDLREILRRDQLAVLGEVAIGMAHQVNNSLEVLLNTLDLLGKYIERVASDEDYIVEYERLESVQRELAKIRSMIDRIDEMVRGGQYGTKEYFHGSRMVDFDIKGAGLPKLPGRGETSSQALAGLTILVVDDDLGVCYSLRDLLQEEGCAVEVATGGLPALEVLAQKRIDLVLSDVVMPDMDGYDLYMKVQERYRHIPIVLMTAYFYDKDHVIKRSKLKGLEEIIFKKPVDPARLKGIILRHCRPAAVPQ
jgi:PAS domain S-box-containing protein